MTKLSGEWRKRHYNGRYAKGDNSFAALREFIILRVKHIDDCWIWQSSIHRDGYGKVNKKPFWQAHRLSYFAFNEKIDNNLLVCHKCHNRLCVRPSHLYQGTHKDNVLDTINAGKARGMFKPGEKHPNSKLHNGLVKHILNLFKIKSVKEISEELNLPRTTVSAVCHRHSWRHIK